MAKNTLGEVIGTPGAARRESASIKRRHADSSAELAEQYGEVAHGKWRRARAMDARADLSYSFPADERKYQPWDYRDEARKARKEASEHSDKARELSQVARSNRRGARVDNAVAVCQTLCAKVGLNLG